MENKKTYLVLTPFFPSDESHVGSYVFDQINEISKQSDFNLKENSPAIDAGNSMGNFNDIEGNTRNNPDIGAYEFVDEL